MSDFLPASLLANPHFQTIYASFRRVRAPTVTRHRLELPDGDFLDVDLATPARPAEGAPWALLLHGLEGNSTKSYVTGLARGLVELGVETCLMNYRGCSGEPNRLARSYHSGETDDVRRVLRWLAATRPGRPWALAGFSIGANLTMKLLGEEGDVPPNLTRGVAISPPFDLEAASVHLDGTAILYRDYLVRSLRAKALAKLKRYPRVANARDVAKARTFSAFDEVFTAPVHGFASARDYWSRSSGGRYLATVNHPLLIITAEDDPFFPRGYIPRDVIAKNPKLELSVATRGGHVGFVSGSFLSPRWWAEERALDALARALTGARVTAPAASLAAG